MTTVQLGILVLVFVGLALLLAIAIHWITRWWKHRPIWDAIENPPRRERRILPPHKSAARPSNVRKIARKPAAKSTPKAAA